MEMLEVDPFRVFHEEWALVTAGNIENYNTMTISWGSLGTIWNKSVVTIYVKPIRYTYCYLEENDYFTVSFYPQEFKKDLGILGSKSGRDGDKVSLTRLIPKRLKNGITFEQSKLTLVCKKIYCQDLDTSMMPDDVVKKYYETEAPHRMYIGEVIEVF